MSYKENIEFRRIKKYYTKEAILLFFLMLGFLSVWAQNGDYTDFYRQSLKTNNTGMYVLGSWAIANMATGAFGWANNTGSTKYFYQMNLFWNVINGTIAGFALYNNYTQDLSMISQDTMLQNHINTEKLFLINGGLDIAYIGTGFLLKHLSNNSSKRPELLKGYGNSLILQGAFLFVFDMVMWGIQRMHRLTFLENTELSFSISKEFTQLTAVLHF
ncbi:hypothetical protein N9164_16100 [Draconibacterium sp.]|nr:hypothetical protein [Draconibacterium sp.]